MDTEKKTNRRQQILETLAGQLEQNPGKPIRTASLAKAVGISEAALYRHFPSKAKMFESLIQFSEETIFSRINKIQQEQKNALIRCEAVLHLILTFSDRNPGIIRVLTGEALMGESEKLRTRVTQFFDRLEMQIKQFLREGVLHGELDESLNVAVIANLISAHIEGKLSQFRRSEFEQRPLAHSDEQWTIIKNILKTDNKLI